MEKLEAKIQGRFTKWLKKTWDGGSGAFELKVTRGNRIAFSKISEHQIFALNKASSNEGLIYKISDSAIGYKPFDCFVLRDCAGYYVFCFFCGRECWLVPVEDVVDLVLGGLNGLHRPKNKGSVTVEWCQAIGRRILV